MSQRVYVYFTIFFLLALTFLSSVAWRDYVQGGQEKDESGGLIDRVRNL